MAGAVTNAAVSLEIKISETESNDLGQSRMEHVWSLVASYATGTGSSQADLVYSDRLSLAGSAQTIDLAGSVASVLSGDTQTYVEVVGFAVLNNSTTTTEVCTVGAGSNPWITWLNATGDAVAVGPGGCLIWTSPIDGGTVTAATGDVLTLDPGADTFTVDVVIWGRSA